MCFIPPTPSCILSLLSPSSSFERSEPPTTCDAASFSRLSSRTFCALGPQQSPPSQYTLWSGTPYFPTGFPCAARFFTAPSGHLTASACLHFSQAHCPRYVYYLCHLQLSLVPRLLAFQRSNDHISLSVGIAGSVFSLLFADSSCCVHRMLLSCQYHACSWTKYPSRLPLLPLHPLATLLSYCILPFYTLLTLVLPISPTFSGAVLHRFELPTCKLHAAHSCRPS